MEDRLQKHGYRDYGLLLCLLELMVAAGMIALSAWGFGHSNIQSVGTLVIALWLMITCILVVAAAVAFFLPGRLEVIHYIGLGAASAASAVFAIVWRRFGHLTPVNLGFAAVAVIAGAGLYLAFRDAVLWRERPRRKKHLTVLK
jgi:hypothetical protein